MERETGIKDYPIWLLGDSNPENWQDSLITPLDPRHPARHNIWTPVLDVIQDRVYRQRRARVDTSSVYIRNAIGDPADKPKGNLVEWTPEVESEILQFRELLERYRPPVLFTFGAFAFEFARRAFGTGPKLRYGEWGAQSLGDEFRRRLQAFDPKEVNLLPLLHTSISRGRFIESHSYFSKKEGGNYFEFVGKGIADKLIEHRDVLQIWIE